MSSLMLNNFVKRFKKLNVASAGNLAIIIIIIKVANDPCIVKLHLIMLLQMVHMLPLL